MTRLKLNLPISTLHTQFVKYLMKWDTSQNVRTMPWKGEKDPYRIWLSEIILQQTRVDQGTAYYNKFITKYPRVKALARAPETEVFKLWEGLGYYTRCKNLIKTAKILDAHFGGRFPDNYSDILELPGIGTYTAAAICSFAYNMPFAVVDGNVFRVLSRFFGIDTPIDTTEGKKLFTQLANELLPIKKSALYNQAIMDFGATVCKPAQPECISCPMKKCCCAFQQDTVQRLPVKLKKTGKKHRYINFWVFKWKNEVLIQQRTSKDVWQNLYQFPITETRNPVKYPAKEMLHAHAQPQNVQIIEENVQQTLTHQIVHADVFECNVQRKFKIEDGIWIKLSSLETYPFPAILSGLLKKIVPA